MTTDQPITPEDAGTALYFMNERGDITRWCAWPHAGIAALPEFDDWRRAQRTADALKAAFVATLTKIEDSQHDN